MQSNFSSFNFHDSPIYAIGFDKSASELLLDIDLIFEWVKEQDNYYSFLLAPCTIVFKNVWDIEMDISMNMDMIIDNIVRENPTAPRNINYLPENAHEFDWKIELLQGEISFKSIGFDFYQRKEKTQKKTQSLSFDERGYISLEKSGILVGVK